LRLLALALVLASTAAGAWSPIAAAAPSGNGDGPDQGDATGPELAARSWILIDARTGQTLASRDENRRLPMASTTKMMTAYLAMERLPLTRRVRAVDYPATPGESLMGLSPGQLVSVRDLLYGLILLSGNDAAVTLARAVSGSEPAFVALMNRTARKLGLTNTSYENSVGLDSEDQFSSAADLARLGNVLMALPRFRRIASSREAELTSYRPPVEIRTLNDFVANNYWAKGIKTGHTLGAGYVLASDGRRKATELVGAVMGTSSELARDAETVELMDYGFSLYDKRVPIRSRKPVASVPVRFEDDGLALFATRPVRIGVRSGERLTVVRALPDEVEGPISKGETLGRATVLVDGLRIARVRLMAGRDVAAPSAVERVWGAVTGTLWLPALLLFAILSVALAVRHQRARSMKSRMRKISRRTR
jgi:D-alanyl-D-alanine carboxypeptidase (penicillin-binding protein 5/6)